MKNERNAMIIVVAYILTMLLIGLVAIATIRKEADAPVEKTTERQTQSNIQDIIYVPVYVESESDSDPIETEKAVAYTVKAHDGRIGIFKDGSLTYIIDVYTNTLPKTDRVLLEEGIVVYSEGELYNIIEDYTS